MDRTARFRVNTPRVIHELFEHEVVIVNLDSGRYYCLQATGVELWHAVESGASVADIVDGLAADYQSADGEIETAVQAILQDLLREDLIAPAATPGQARDAAPTRAGGSASGQRPFQTPTLQTYTDMQDLLLLDPIHEVDEIGWPVAAKPAKKDTVDTPR